MRKTYQEKKEELRNEAIKWSMDFNNHNYYLSELINFQQYFEKFGKRYGLLKEFHENAIC